MTLQSGQRLEPYEIIGALAEGGMGQVYRARDTKLDREVAIKVLPPQVANEGAEADDGKTQTSLTSPGTVMGTVGYMAPEQVRAKPTDARTDIFSFGTVLYEMLTGRRAFQRETNAETMTAILREEPTELSASGLSVPPTIAAVVRRCLEKRPEERFHSARDVAFALEALGSESSTGGHAAADLPEVAPSRGAKRVPAIGGALLLAAAAFVGGRLLAPGGAAPDAAVVTNLVQLTFESGTESQPAISPDGKSLAYVVSRGQGRDIFVKRVGGESTIELMCVAMMDRGVEEDIVVAATDGNGVRRLTNDSFKDRQPVWTSDSRRIVFFSDRSGRYQAWWVGVEGGGLEQLTDVQEELLFNPFVSPDGGTLLYQSFGGGKRVDLALPHPVRTAEPLPRLPDDRGFVAWDWSPDGTRVVGAAADELYSGGLWLLHTADDRFEKLTDDGILGRFLPDSRTVLYGWNGGLRLIDVASRESRVLHAAGLVESPLGLSYDSDGRHLYATSFETQGDVWLLRAAAE